MVPGPGVSVAGHWVKVPVVFRSWYSRCILWVPLREAQCSQKPKISPEHLPTVDDFPWRFHLLKLWDTKYQQWDLATTWLGARWARCRGARCHTVRVRARPTTLCAGSVLRPSQRPLLSAFAPTRGSYRPLLPVCFPGMKGEDSHVLSNFDEADLCAVPALSVSLFIILQHVY